MAFKETVKETSDVPRKKSTRQEPIPESGLKAEGVGGSSERCLVATAEKHRVKRLQES